LLKKDKLRLSQLLPQSQNTKQEISKFRILVQDLELGLAAEKSHAAQALISIEEIGGHWEVMDFAECRQEVIEVANSFIKAIQDSKDPQEGDINVKDSSRRLQSRWNSPQIEEILEEMQTAVEEVNSLTPLVEQVITNCAGTKQNADIPWRASTIPLLNPSLAVILNIIKSII
jgi:hypothetical protein